MDLANADVVVGTSADAMTGALLASGIDLEQCYAKELAPTALFDTDDTRDGNLYIIAGARWAGRENLWHAGDDGPTCVGTDTTARIHVRMGIVDIGSEVGSWPHVVWLQCI